MPFNVRPSSPSKVIPSEQGLRQKNESCYLAPIAHEQSHSIRTRIKTLHHRNNHNHFLASKVIPSEQGLRLAGKQRLSFSLKSKVFPSEQGLRQSDAFAYQVKFVVSKGIPLEQGLDKTGKQINCSLWLQGKTHFRTGPFVEAYRLDGYDNNRVPLGKNQTASFHILTAERPRTYLIRHNGMNDENNVTLVTKKVDCLQPMLTCYIFVEKRICQAQKSIPSDCS